MSKELADKLSGIEATKATKEKARSARNNSTVSDEFSERIEAHRNGDFVPKKVNSWSVLWDREEQ